MSHTMLMLTSSANLSQLRSALALPWRAMAELRAEGNNVPSRRRSSSRGGVSLGFGGGKVEPSWKCMENCGACCKLDKGRGFATPEEIFPHSSQDVELYRSLVGVDGWCIHYEKSTRTCAIYADRPYFCRVDPDVFKTLYGIQKKKFNKEACSFCRDIIKAIYGAHSTELKHFNGATRSTR